MRSPRARTTALAAAGLLVLGACAGSTDRATTATSARPSPATQASSVAADPVGGGSAATEAAAATTASDTAAPSPLPDVSVLNAGTGETVQLAALLPADRPLLVWFWAPH